MSVLIIIPCVALNEYVLECLSGCLGLDYAEHHIALLPDAPVALPEEFISNKITVIPTGDVTISAKRNAGIRAFPDAEYYAFIDSDAYPHHDWLKTAIPSFSHGAVWAVRTCRRPMNTCARRLWETRPGRHLYPATSLFPKRSPQAGTVSIFIPATLLFPGGPWNVSAFFMKG